jgi:hypothetical protein
MESCLGMRVVRPLHWRVADVYGVGGGSCPKSSVYTVSVKKGWKEEGEVG